MLLDEYALLQKGIGFALLSDATLCFEGKDVQKFLQGALSNDLKLLKPNHGLSAFFLTTKGRWVAYLKLFEKNGKVFTNTSPLEAKNLEENIKNLILFSDSSLEDLSTNHQWILVIGAQVENFLQEVLKIKLNAEDFSHQTVSFENKEIEVLRDNSWIFPAFLILSSKKDVPDLLQKFNSLRIFPSPTPPPSRGGGRGAGEVLLLSDETLNTLKIESGIPTFGIEVDDKTLPLEAGLDSAISYTKGCYLGQETISRIKHYGHVNKLISKISWQGEAVALNSQILFQEKEVGKILNQSFSPHYQSMLGLSLIHKEAFTPGTEVKIQTPTLSYSAQVVK